MRPSSSASPRSPAPSSRRSDPSGGTAVESGSNRFRSRCRSVAGPPPSGARAELGDGSAELVPEHAEQLGASGECLPVLERHRHRHLAGVGERADELDLLAGQIVESVQEDRPRRPGPRLAAERGGRSRGELVIVGELAAISKRFVGFEQRDQLALVVPGVPLGDGEGEAAGVEPRGLQVGQQRLQSGREPIAAGRAREPAQRCLGGRCPSEPDPLHRAQPVDGVEAHRPPDLAEQPREAGHGSAEDPSGAGAEVPLEAVDVVAGRRHEDRLALQRLPKRRQHGVAAPRPRRPGEYRQAHRRRPDLVFPSMPSEHRSLGGLIR